MQFNSEKELRNFLSDFLTTKGYQCTIEYPLPSGEFLDILAPPFAIECKHRLNRKTLDSAVGQLCGRYMPHLKGFKPVVAGLSRKSGRSAADSYQRNGIAAIWFIDEIQEVCDYYDELYGYKPEPEYEYTYYPTSSYSSTSYDVSGCFWVFAAIVGILALIGYSGVQKSSPVRELHRSAINWDTKTADKAIARLRASEDECEVFLGNTFLWERQSAFQEGATLREVNLRTFNRINVIQEWLVQRHPQCRYPRLNHPDQFDE